jgi:hypothetical protein
VGHRKPVRVCVNSDNSSGENCNTYNITGADMSVSLSPPSGDSNRYYVYPGNTYYIYPGNGHDYYFHHGDDHGFGGRQDSGNIGSGGHQDSGNIGSGGNRYGGHQDSGNGFGGHQDRGNHKAAELDTARPSLGTTNITEDDQW